MLDQVDQRYGDVLRPRDLDFSRAFRGAGLGAQRLYVRLVSRAGPVFRSDRIRYDEIPDLPAAAAVLVCAGLLGVDVLGTSDTLEGAVALLRKAELEEILALARRGTTGPGVGVADLRARCLTSVDPNLLRAEILRRFHVYEPLAREEISVYRLLFFGNAAQDLTSFVLADLGVVRYEPYRIDPEDRLFTSRAELETALTLRESLARLAAAVELGDAEGIRGSAETATAVPPGEATDPLRDEILVRAGRALERLQAPDEALRVYALTEAPPSRERRARILSRRGETAAALELCGAIAANPRDEAEIQFATVFSRRLTREPRPPEGHPAAELLTLTYDASTPIEQAVLDHYIAQGWTGLRSENTLWTGIFGLILWDIIFEPHRGAFLHPFQRGPRDLYTPRFRERRAAAIERRLESIRGAGGWIEAALDVYDRRHGVACAPVAWQHLERGDLIRTARRVPAEQVALILDRLAANLGVHGSGLPDLLLFPPDEGYRLVEVKGPGDHVQPNQERWMAFFAAHAMPARVARVVWNAG